MTGSEFAILYSTFPDRAAAEKTARALVDAGLAACVNIFAPMTSVYRWQGKLETTTEVAVFIKTRRALMDEAISTARATHPNELPCFLAIPVDGGSADYLSWLRTETPQAG
jgi:periplasmic divalent cation tolerance protein